MTDINNMRQNHPELIVMDLEKYVEADVVRHILKYRGVNKWLRVRRLLIQLKDAWKVDIDELEAKKRELWAAQDYRQFYKMQGYVEALKDCRQQVRALCHSPRDVDFPLDPHDFGDACVLPEELPQRPNKRWFWTHGFERGIA